MFIKVVNHLSGRRMRMEDRTLGKLLHLAAFHGWRPERVNWTPPSAKWDTDRVMPFVAPYLSGVVSESDAAGLLVGLKRVFDSEGTSLTSEVYLALLALTAIAEGGSFEMIHERPTTKRTSQARGRRPVPATDAATS